MSKDYQGILLYFEREVSEEYIRDVTRALRLIGNVHDVVPIPARYEDYIVEQRVRQELTEKLIEIAYPERAKRRKRGED